MSIHVCGFFCISFDSMSPSWLWLMVPVSDGPQARHPKPDGPTKLAPNGANWSPLVTQPSMWDEYGS